MKKVAGWAVALFLLYYVVTAPDRAATSARSLAGGVGNIADAIGQFLSRVVA
jgi:hypothetical protein